MRQPGKVLIPESPQWRQREPKTPTMNFEGRLRSIEERYDLSESERARELGRAVADLKD